MAPRGPQKGQKSILMGSLVVLDPNDSPKKISSIFGTGCHKVCTCLLNGAIVTGMIKIEQLHLPKLTLIYIKDRSSKDLPSINL